MSAEVPPHFEPLLVAMSPTAFSVAGFERVDGARFQAFKFQPLNWGMVNFIPLQSMREGWSTQRKAVESGSLSDLG